MSSKSSILNEKYLTVFDFDTATATLALNALGLAMPLVLLQLYDRIIPAESYDTLLFLAIGLFSAVVLDGLLRIARAQLVTRSGAHFEHRMNLKACRAILHTPAELTETYPAAVHMARIGGIERIREFRAGVGAFSMMELPFLSLYFLGLAIISIPIAFMMLSLCVIIAFASLFLGYSLKNLSRRRQVWDERRQSFLTEMLFNIHNIKGMAAENAILRRHEKLYESCAVANYDLSIQHSYLNNVGSAFAQASILIVAVFGSLLVIDESLTIGQLSACMLLAGRVTEPVLNCAQAWSQYQAASLAKTDLVNCLLSPTEINPIKVRGGSEKRRLVLENITTNDDDSDNLVLQSVNLEATEGEITNIQCSSGPIRHILAKLLVGQHSPSSGSISICLKHFSIEQDTILQKLVLVKQDPILFAGSIFDNITSFQTENVKPALKLADVLGLYNHISALPDGYDTKVDAVVDTKLALGVSQQICLIRALASEPYVVVYDDALNMFEPEHKVAIARTVKELNPRLIQIFLTSDGIYETVSDQSFSFDNATLSKKSRQTDSDHMFLGPER